MSIFDMLYTKITRFEFCTIQSGLSANKLLRSQCWSKKSGRKPVVRHAFSAFEEASFPTGKCLSVFCNKNKEKLRKIKRFYGVLVRVGRLELPASCSQSRRATNCATPGYQIFQLWSNMWSRSFFDQLQARGKVLSTQMPQGFAGFPWVETRTRAPRTQITCATNCATPGYEIVLSVVFHVVLVSF